MLTTTTEASVTVDSSIGASNGTKIGAQGPKPSSPLSMRRIRRSEFVDASSEMFQRLPDSVSSAGVSRRSHGNGTLAMGRNSGS